MWKLGIVLVFLAGCTTTGPVCDTAKAVSSVLASQIAFQLDCKDMAAVQADIDKKLVKLHVCDPAVPVAMSPFGDVVCPSLVAALVGGAVTTLPVSWQCSGGPAGQAAMDKLVAFCKLKL